MISTSRELSVSFIIPVRNGERFVDGCIGSIEAEMQPNDEIIVVDNGSTDGTPMKVRGHARVRLLEFPDVNISAVRNRGAAAAKGDAFAFIDADCLVQPGWRNAVVTAFASTEVHATGSTCALPSNPSWVELAWVAKPFESPREVGYINSGNLVIRREVFVAVSGFDETLVTDEDCDIAFRIKRAGGRVLDAPGARAIHLGNPKTIAQFARREKWHSSSIVETMILDGIDKPMMMTIGFIFSWIVALGCCMAAVVWGEFLLVLGSSAIFVAPLFSAIYRVSRGARVGYLLELTLLYFIFYLVRTKTIVEYPFRSRSKGSR